MFRNYLAAALRNLVRNKVHAAIMIVGMSVGLAAALLIGLVLRDNLTYDKWIPGHDNVYRASAGFPGKRTTNAAPSDLGPWLALEFPQIEAVTRLFRDAAAVSVGDREFMESVEWADPNFFNVIQLPAIAGDLATALARPDGVVLTRHLALKYFNRPDPVGETMLFFRTYPMQVTAVIEDLPSNTQFARTDMIASAQAAFSPSAEQDRNPVKSFGQKLWSAKTFFRLAPGSDVEAIREAMPGVLDRRSAEPKESTKKAGAMWAITIMPLADVNLTNGIPPHPQADYGVTYVWIALGLLITFAAGINFVNLMTARASRRALEVGVRKSSGAQRRHLMFQFLGEALVYVLISAAMAFGLVALLLPPLNAAGDGTLTLRSIWTDPTLFFGSSSFLVVTAFLAGLYPALILSAFRPAKVLRVGMSSGLHGNIVRQILVILQFAILIGLSISTTVFYRQADFSVRDSLRHTTDPILLIKSSCSDALRDAVVALPGVQGAACGFNIPQLGMGNSSAARRQGMAVDLRYGSIDAGLFEQYGLTPAAGRFFARERASDSVPDNNTWPAPEAVIINETAARALGFQSPQAAIGQTIDWYHIYQFPSTVTPVHPAEIIGVVEDFRIGGNRSEIFPAAFYMDPKQRGILSVKLRGAQTPETLDAIRDVWKRVGDPRPIEIRFYDRAVQQLYVGLLAQTYAFGVSAGIAIFIAVLGLIGLAAFAAERRTKEIGIRKAMGAKKSDILRLLLWQFTKPVLWANVIAWPVAYVATNRWLESFAYHIDLALWMFFAASGLALVIALLTVIGHALLVARSQPVKALRYE